MATPAPTKTPRECGTCKFWDKIGERTGLCRKNAPVATNRYDAQTTIPGTFILFAPALWPSTMEGENCGEHKHAPMTADEP